MIKRKLTLSLLATLCVNTSMASEWPVGISDDSSTLQNQSVSIPVISNDTGSNLEITSVNESSVKWGRITINADKKSLSYKPYKDFKGSDSFWYVLKDGEGRTNAAKVTVNVTEQVRPPQWPSSVGESPEVNYNQPIELAVLDNDQGVGLVLTDVNTTTVKYGSVSISSDGKKLIYTPPQDYAGNDEFWYVFKDAWGRTNAGKVTPVVLEEQTNSPWPTATPDYTSTVSTRSIVIPVLKNDLGDGLKIVEVNTTTVEAGKASIRNGYIRYTPPTNFSGQDSFWYAFEDKDGRTNSTQVFVDVTKNTQLSSVEFCGANYFTDGTLENTSTSNNAPDSESVELDTSADVETFVSPEGALAVVGDNRYLLETSAQGKQLVVEKNGQRTVLHAFSQDDVYGVGVRNNTFFFGIVSANQPETPSGISINSVRHNLLSHNGVKLQTLGSYLLLPQRSELVQPIQMMKTKKNTLVRFVGYENIGEGPAVVPVRQEYPYQYYEINAQDGKAMYLASHADFSFQSARVSTVTQEKVFSFDQHLISSAKVEITGRGPDVLGFDIRSADYEGLLSSPRAKLDKAVVSNNRLLLTTLSHSYFEGDAGAVVETAIPAKLYSFDGGTGKFVELATCN